MNDSKLSQIPEPKITMTASHPGPLAENASSYDAMGLEPTLEIKVGAKVIVLHNLNVKTGIVYGSMGEFFGYLSAESVCVVYIQSYSGPLWCVDNSKYVPIPRTTLTWCNSCGRMLPAPSLP